MLSRISHTGVPVSQTVKSRTPSIEVKPRHGTVNPVRPRHAMRLEPVSALRRCSSLLGILENDAAPMIVGEPPLLDLLQGSKAAEAGQVVV
jgi:hypothetical protein